MLFPPNNSNNLLAFPTPQPKNKDCFLVHSNDEIMKCPQMESLQEVSIMQKGHAITHNYNSMSPSFRKHKSFQNTFFTNLLHIDPFVSS